MPSQNYWQKRFERLSEQQFRKDDVVADRLKKEYDRASSRIQKDVEVFYGRLAANNYISMSDARKMLTGKELESFKLDVEDFITIAKNNPDEYFTAMLNEMYYRTRVSRLEAIRTQMNGHIMRLGISEQEQTSDLLSDVYQDTYYRTLYELQKGNGVGVSFASLDEKTIKRVINKAWLGENYSDRIWGDKKKLARELETEIAQSVIRGDSGQEAMERLSERFDVTYSSARRLVRTESAHIHNEATFNSYRASGVVERYEYLATLDSRTSSVCRDVDGETFRLADKEVGVNYPPLHPNCRSTTVPYFPDEEEVGTRLARKDNGEVYRVSGDITYKDWYDQYVERGD